MATATTRTTTAAARTMVAIAAKKLSQVERSRPNTASNASAWTLIIKATPTVKGAVSSRITKGMATATTRTTTAAARTMVAIAAKKNCRRWNGQDQILQAMQVR